MNQSDPTDNALAAIASILDSPRASSEPPKPPPLDEPAAAQPPPIPVPPPLPSEDVEAEAVVEAPPPPPPAEPEQVEAARIEAPPVEPAPAEAPPLEANGYSRVGPGPMAALRFKWTVREDNGQYFVDESIGENGTPLVNGPMDKDAAIKFVDDRAAESHQRFEHLKNEMIERAVARRDDSEA